MDLDGSWHPALVARSTRRVQPRWREAGLRAVVDLFIGRLWTYPEAHIYHFAPYEPTALKRLMGRHATRENEVDRLLRGGALIDLHRLVRQSIRASVEGYGIKKLEPLYGFTRSVDLRDAGSSIVAFEEWLQLEGGRAAERGSPAPDRGIQPRRRDQQPDAAGLARGAPRRPRAPGWNRASPPGTARSEPSPGLNDRQMAVAAVADRLTADVPADGRTPEQQARWLLAQLLSWHRRRRRARGGSSSTSRTS